MTTAFDVRRCDLRKLNSATKYPSIPTYHDLDPSNGNLLEKPLPFDGMVLATEKVDGTNSRIICLPDGSFLLGSRERLLFAKGDLIGDPALGIVDSLNVKAEQMAVVPADDVTTVFYCEVFGGKVTAGSKQYTGERNTEFRLFDIAQIRGFDAVLSQGVEQISTWREHGGQLFLAEADLLRLAEENDFEVTPRIMEVAATELPTSVEDGLQFLENAISTTQCLLDEGGGGQPEGLVVRTRNRSSIAKLRFQDYRRTLKRRKSGKHH